MLPIVECSAVLRLQEKEGCKAGDKAHKVREPDAKNIEVLQLLNQADVGWRHLLRPTVRYCKQL